MYLEEASRSLGGNGGNEEIDGLQSSIHQGPGLVDLHTQIADGTEHLPHRLQPCACAPLFKKAESGLASAIEFRFSSIRSRNSSMILFICFRLINF